MGRLICLQWRDSVRNCLLLAFFSATILIINAKLSIRLRHLLMRPMRSVAKMSQIDAIKTSSPADPRGVVECFIQREIGTAVVVENTQVISIRHDLLRWYLKNRRLMPWRGDTVEVTDSVASECKSSNDSNCNSKLYSESDELILTTFKRSGYGTWISEIMLQQTRVETVIPYWLKWMAKFPTIQSLASASEDEVNAMWAGLGYYRRAQQLLKGARKVIKDFNGQLPETVAELKTIDGIGPYTAGAISSIAFNKVEPLVDGNVIRVLSRLYALKESVGSTAMEKISWSIASQLVDIESPGDFNQGLMELGSTKCKPTSPSCGDCPLHSVCRARILIDYQKGPKICTNDEIVPTRKSSVGEKSEIKPNFEIFNRREIIKTNMKTELQYEINELEENADTKDADIGLSSSGLPLSISFFPQKMKKKEPKDMLVSVSVFIRKEKKSNLAEKVDPAEDKYLFIRRPDNKGLLANQWEFPNVIYSIDGEVCSTADTHNNTKYTTKRKMKIEESITKISDDKLPLVMSTFFRNTLGIDWRPFSGKTLEQKEEEIKLVSAVTSSSAFFLGKRKHESSIPKTFPNDTIAGSGTIDLTNDESLCNTDKFDNLIARVSATCPCVLLPPIVHVFSHQRHTMHITANCVEVSSGSAISSERSSAYAGRMIDSSQPEMGSIATSWKSFCGGGREIRWMTASEIFSAGITTGCRKILAEVTKLP